MAVHSQAEVRGDNEEAGRLFWCFISYRHADNTTKGREWATWLHRELETYEVPAELVGETNEWGHVIPDRIYPVFRDEEELPAYADLSSAIMHALERSMSLVVICSPDSKRSKFVNEEIARFKAFGRDGRICGMVIRGEPDVSSPSDCLPLPLVRRVSSGGEVLQIAETPLLVDLRDADGGEEWHDTELRTAGLLAAGRDVAEAKSESAARESKLQESKLFLISWVLGISSSRLNEAHERLARARRRARYVTWGVWGLLGVAGVLAVWLGVRVSMGMIQETTQSAGNAEKAKMLAQKTHQEIVAKDAEAAGLRLETLYAEAISLEQAQRWPEALAVLRKAHEGGSVLARVELARLLAEGRGAAPDKVAAVALLESAVASGNHRARALLGGLLSADPDSSVRARGIELLRRCHLEGDRTVRVTLAKAAAETNPKEAIELLTGSADAGDPEAAWLLGALLKKEPPVTVAAGRMPDWYERWVAAADAGWVPAKRDAGFAMLSGALGPVFSFKTEVRRAALRRLVDAVNAADGMAMKQLSSLYETPANYPQDSAELEDFLIDGAKAGVPKAMFELAQLYAGRANSADSPSYHLAKDWYGRSGQAGLSQDARMGEATLMLRIAKGSKNTNSKSMVSAAYERFAELAKAGKVDAMIMAAETIQLMDDPRSSSLAEQWLRLAERKDSPEARRLLAVLLIGGGKAPLEAMELLRKGVELGDGEAALILGNWMLSHAKGKEQLSKTFEVYEKGAQAGNGLCALNCAAMLRKGQGVPTDLAKSDSFELRAAETGDPFCMMERGRTLLSRKDETAFPEAYAWLLMASEAGKSKECSALLAKVSALLGDARRAKGLEIRKNLLKNLRSADSGKVR